MFYEWLISISLFYFCKNIYTQTERVGEGRGFKFYNTTLGFLKNHPWSGKKSPRRFEIDFSMQEIVRTSVNPFEELLSVYLSLLWIEHTFAYNIVNKIQELAE